MNHTINKYLFQALDAYPHNLEEAVECINYALSYDENNTTALGLLGQIYAEKLKKYEIAKELFQQALAHDIYALNIYPKYILVLLYNEDYAEADKLIQFALTIKGIDKACIYELQSFFFESQKEYKKALACLKLAKRHTYNNAFMTELKEEISRVKSKLSATKKKPKKKKAKKNKKKKTETESESE